MKISQLLRRVRDR